MVNYIMTFPGKNDKPHAQKLLDIIQGVFWEDHWGQSPNQEGIGHLI